MITHEEAKKYVHNIITEDTTMKHHRPARELYEYANQQEAQEQRLKKVEELLGVYKQLHKEIDLSVGKDSFDDWDGGGTYEYIEIDTEKDHTAACDILNKIKQLEKELGL